MRLRAMLILSVVFTCSLSHASIKRAIWQAYDADANMTSHTTVQVIWETAESSVVQIVGRHDGGEWAALSDWIPTDDLHYSTGTATIVGLLEGFWELCAIPQPGIEPTQEPQLSFWVLLQRAVQALRDDRAGLDYLYWNIVSDAAGVYDEDSTQTVSAGYRWFGLHVIPATGAAQPDNNWTLQVYIDGVVVFNETCANTGQQIFGINFPWRDLNGSTIRFRATGMGDKKQAAVWMVMAE